MNQIDKCSECECDRIIVNKKYFLCQICNYKRLHPDDENNNSGFKQTAIKVNVNAKKPKQKAIKKTPSKRGLEQIKSDEKIYEIVHKIKPCFCEECSTYLPTDFRGEDGKVNARFQYSHILSKGSHPEFRENVLNFNKLCLGCHTEWENGDKTKMKIYAKNCIIIEKLYESTQE